ncbi:MAG TPA: vanadium-dependent haloperoxidase [Casimicrobiaceae bacterium]|nr:vanadium-dependent haloperoxidase [Casimicrobiaceae bacterium]
MNHSNRFAPDKRRRIGTRPRSLMLVAACCAAASGATNSTAAATDAAVLRWNEIAVETVGDVPPFPATRAMAIVQVAVFEAIDAITHRYGPYLGTVTASPGASEEAAAVVAAHDALAGLFPGQQGLLDRKQAESLATITPGSAKDEGMAVGKSAAAVVLAKRSNDGAQAPMFYTPASAAPYHWQPTASCANPPASGRGLFFHWQFVKPFGVQSSTQFRAKVPPALVSDRYAKDMNEVQGLGEASSTGRSADRAAVARFYAAQSPHRGWNLVTRQLAAERGADEITRTARTLAILNMSLSDAHVTVFESKYHYLTWRPETAIARADEDGNPRTAPSAGYRPLVATPCFPGYPSAHGAGGGAARTVLERAYGRTNHHVTLTDDKVSETVLSYSDLRTITDDVADARVFGGIHFRYDQDAGDEIGVEVGRYNDEHWLLPLHPGEAQ